MLVSRVYHDDVDHLRVMDFLRKTFAETGGLENWLPPRFENNSRELDPWIRVWDDEGGLVGLVVPEKPFQYFVQLHPGYLYLYDEMVEWVEDYCRSRKGDEEVRLCIVELEGSPVREEALRRRGFSREGLYGIFRLRGVDAPIPDYGFPDGFSVRSATPDDFDEIASCIRQVFGHGEWFTREVLEELAGASFYNPDLDLVAVDEAGKIVSFCTFRVDVPSGTTELEPMGTLAEYRGLGIGRALLCEGFRRLNKYNTSLLYIGGAANNPAANRLYELTGFTTRFDMYRWVKLI
ncbi:GNAT family N-acetyltransferase [Candidatus Bathyarchaeota archaeon]|nr:MAG: GNAT family N-acetyltransferase [Candidatus Bathyarchaeota archaeon]